MSVGPARGTAYDNRRVRDLMAPANQPETGDERVYRDPAMRDPNLARAFPRRRRQ